MIPYHVECTSTQTGRHVWSGTWEAQSPADAIAQATLAPAERESFREFYQGTEGVEELQVPHPCGGRFVVKAEVWQ